MQKHADITLRRCQSYLAHQLLPAVMKEGPRLQTLFLPGAFPDSGAALAAEGWREIEPGFCWGPAYSEGWYRIQGEVSEELAGLDPAITYDKAELKWERWPMVEGTVWRDGRPSGGLDFGHQYFRLEGLKPGDRFDLLVQAWAHNREVTVHGREKPRTAEPEEFKGFLLAGLDGAVMGLMYDFEFHLSLVQSLPADEPAREVLLRMLNDVCNEADLAHPRSISAVRKAIWETAGSLRTALDHAVAAVGHSHLDTAWLWPLSITHLKMVHTTAIQLDLLERHPEHHFAHSQASQYEWLEKEQPALFERVRQMVKKGQWEPVGSMWVEADCNLAGGESLVRQFLYGRRWFQQKLGVETKDMWLPDVFGYSAALPQILCGFGIEYFLTQKLSWSQTNKIPHHTFWWKGIDGSRIWTHFPPADTYIHSMAAQDIRDSVLKFKDHGRSGRSILLYGFGDGGGGPTEQHIERLKRAQNAPGMPRVESRKKAVQFFEEAKAESRDLMTWSGELYLEFHRGTYTTQAACKRANRECEFLLRDAELLSCFRPGFPEEYPAEELEAAWKLVLLNQFHDIIPGSSVNEVYVDAHRDYALAREAGERAVSESLKAIAARLDSSGLERPIAIFHNSEAPGQAEVAWDGEAPAGLIVNDEVLPVQKVDDFGASKLIFETPLDALGAVAVGEFTGRAPDQAPRLKASSRKLENDTWSVRFDANGHITSLRSLADSPVEFIAEGRLANVFQLLDDKPLFWSAWDVDPFAMETARDLLKADRFELVETGPVRAAVEVERTFGRSRIRQRISLGPTPGIRFDTEIDWHEEDKMLKVAFPVAVNSPRATYEIQYGHVERPTHQNTSWDAARFEVCQQKWFDLSETGHGLSILNDGKYGCDVVENVMRLTLLRSPKAPDPEADMGLHRFTYALYPHYGPVQHGDTVAAAYALNAPVRTEWLEPSAGEPGRIEPLASVDSRSLVVESVKKAEDSGLVVVRLYECHNSRGSAQLSLAIPAARAWRADLNEAPQQELEVEDGAVRISYRPFEIITLLLEV
jgi:alpha-mannosidase